MKAIKFVNEKIEPFNIGIFWSKSPNLSFLSY